MPRLLERMVQEMENLKILSIQNVTNKPPEP
jgi:hypothetical protein